MLWDEFIKVSSRFHLDKFLQKLLKPQLFDTAIGRSMWPCNCLFYCNVDYWRALQLIDMLKKKHRIHFMTKSYNTFCKQGYACILVHSNKIYLCSLKVCKCKRVKENFAENHWIHSSSEIIEWKKQRTNYSWWKHYSFLESYWGWGAWHMHSNVFREMMSKNRKLVFRSRVTFFLDARLHLTK